MITNSFIFLDKISYKKEKAIWNQGIKDWQDFINTKKIKGISNKSKSYYKRKIIQARTALFNNCSSYFIDKIPSIEMWRIYNHFKDHTVFMDIEASRTSKLGFITVFGLYDGFDVKQMIKDINLNCKALKKELFNYKLIVTFNGSSFDIPFIKKKYPDLLPEVPHLDLRHACAKINLKGGLKQIEKQLGIKRDNELIERMYGGDPYLLWKKFIATHDKYFLDLLLEYNQEDVVNLKIIADKVVDRLEKRIKK
jgi:uncharacterized protein YprB with RNaseH-like and TPR domain